MKQYKTVKKFKIKMNVNTPKSSKENILEDINKSIATLNRRWNKFGTSIKTIK